MKILLCNYECMPNNKNSFQGLSTYFPFATIKITRNFSQSQKAIQTTNPDCDIVIEDYIYIMT